MPRLQDVYSDELFLDSLGLTFEYGETTCGSRKVRHLPCKRIVQVGDNNFDRWANSVEEEFDLSSKNGRDQLEAFISVEKRVQEKKTRKSKTFWGKVESLINRIELIFWHDWDSFSIKPVRWRNFSVIAISLESAGSYHLETHCAFLGLHVALTFYKSRETLA